VTAIRRVVTGHSPVGKAVVASDTPVEGLAPVLTPGAEFHRLWGADAAPSFPDDGTPPATPTYFPPVGGFRVGFFSVPPDGTSRPGADVDLAAAFGEFEAALPGLAGFMEPGAPGMHTTPTVDFEVVVEGEVWLGLDDGVEVHLRAGDTVVQNGTRHAWRNHGTTTARLVVVLVGAHHATAPAVAAP
jgi:mannose-6-phosphate isomerase-like protein (cupin superfamily)